MKLTKHKHHKAILDQIAEAITAKNNTNNTNKTNHKKQLYKAYRYKGIEGVLTYTRPYLSKQGQQLVKELFSR